MPNVCRFPLRGAHIFSQGGLHNLALETFGRTVASIPLLSALSFLRHPCPSSSAKAIINQRGDGLTHRGTHVKLMCGPENLDCALC